MAALAALCKPHSASKQKLSTPVHSTLLDDFDHNTTYNHRDRSMGTQRYLCPQRPNNGCLI